MGRTVLAAAGAVFASVVALLLLIEHGPDFVDDLLLPRPPLPALSSGRPRRWGPHNDIATADGDCRNDDTVDAEDPTTCTATATTTTNEFKLHVEDGVLDDLNDRLARWRPPGAPTLEGKDASWSYGINSDFVARLVRDEWKDKYDWRKHEAQLNDLGLHETVVDGLLIRMHHIKRGSGKKALLLLHGWPGSIWEFHGFIQKILTNNTTSVLDGYSIVCPSLPGYGFSSAPTKEGYNTVAMAGTMQRLMKKLGYERYIIQAGDWGSMVAQEAAYLDPCPVMGLHLNFFPVSPSPGHLLSDEIKIRFLDDEDSRRRHAGSRDFAEVLMNTGYMHQQATKPDTLSYGLSDSPVGLCAWITEKFQSWSDPALPLEEKFDLEDVITNCMVYWITNTIGSSVRLYKEHFGTTEGNAILSVPITDVPVALSLFPFELFPPADTPIKRHFKNILLFRKHEKGGHFAALEHPGVLLNDLVDFVGILEKKDLPNKAKECSSSGSA